MIDLIGNIVYLKDGTKAKLLNIDPTSFKIQYQVIRCIEVAGEIMFSSSVEIVTEIFVSHEETFKDHYDKNIKKIPYFLDDGTKVVINKKVEDCYEVNKIYKNIDEDFERIDKKTLMVSKVFNVHPIIQECNKCENIRLKITDLSHQLHVLEKKIEMAEKTNLENAIINYNQHLSSKNTYYFQKGYIKPRQLYKTISLQIDFSHEKGISIKTSINSEIDIKYNLLFDPSEDELINTTIRRFHETPKESFNYLLQELQEMNEKFLDDKMKDLKNKLEKERLLEVKKECEDIIFSKTKLLEQVEEKLDLSNVITEYIKQKDSDMYLISNVRAG